MVTIALLDQVLVNYAPEFIYRDSEDPSHKVSILTRFKNIFINLFLGHRICVRYCTCICQTPYNRYRHWRNRRWLDKHWHWSYHWHWMDKHWHRHWSRWTKNLIVFLNYSIFVKYKKRSYSQFKIILFVSFHCMKSQSSNKFFVMVFSTLEYEN